MSSKSLSEVEPNESNNGRQESLLSDKAILEHMERGSIVIEPFNIQNLSTSSYDVTLGPQFYRETGLKAGDHAIYNPYSEKAVERIWGLPQHAQLASEWKAVNGDLENIFDDDLIIWLAPGETILGHTNEFIGGRETVTTMMKARSSWGRNFIEVCKCAGWGDVGYINRWTMEITNNSQHYSIPLVVGRRIAQIVFFACGRVLHDTYEKSGKYQRLARLDALAHAWQPSDMLPKMYLDREIRLKKLALESHVSLMAQENASHI